MWHPRLDQHTGVEAGTVHRDEVIGVDLLEGIHGLVHHIVGGGCEVPPAHHGVDFADTRDLLDLPNRVDDPSMAARGDDDQPAILHVIDCGNLALEYIAD